MSECYLTEQPGCVALIDSVAIAGLRSTDSPAAEAFLHWKIHRASQNTPLSTPFDLRF
jgi:hypothetical protein